MPQRRARRWQQPIAKHCKTQGEFIKDCVMKMVKKICPEKKQEGFFPMLAWLEAPRQGGLKTFHLILRDSLR